MAGTAWVVEIHDMPRLSPNAPFQVPSFPALAEHSFAFDVTANAMTAAASSLCRAAMVFLDTTGSMSVGVAPVATAGSCPVPANTAVWIGLQPGHKVSIKLR